MRLARKGGILVVGNHYLKETINKIVEKKKRKENMKKLVTIENTNHQQQ